MQEGPEDDIEDDLFTVNAFTGVSFDVSAASHASLEGADPRFLLGCFN